MHKKLRTKRLAPKLIKEITRRVNLQGVWRAVYTAGRVLPSPVSVCRYYHRSLNPKKLIEVKFSHLGPRMTMARTLRLYRLPEEPQVPGIRKMVAADVPQSCALLKRYLAQFKLSLAFSEEEFAHWFLTREGVVYSFVVEARSSGSSAHTRRWNDMRMAEMRLQFAVLPGHDLILPSRAQRRER